MKFKRISFFQAKLIMEANLNSIIATALAVRAYANVATLTGHHVQAALRVLYAKQAEPYIAAGLALAARFSEKPCPMPRNERSSIAHMESSIRALAGQGTRIGSDLAAFVQGVLGAQPPAFPPVGALAPHELEARLANAAFVLVACVGQKTIRPQEILAAAGILRPGRVPPGAFSEEQAASAAVRRGAKAELKTLATTQIKGGRVGKLAPACLQVVALQLRD
jgi:hypothetical protein